MHARQRPHPPDHRVGLVPDPGAGRRRLHCCFILFFLFILWWAPDRGADRCRLAAGRGRPDRHVRPAVRVLRAVRAGLAAGGRPRPARRGASPGVHHDPVGFRSLRPLPRRVGALLRRGHPGHRPLLLRLGVLRGFRCPGTRGPVPRGRRHRGGPVRPGLHLHPHSRRRHGHPDRPAGRGRGV
ncbi:hypothetical protein ACFFX0_11375 [Citricoccus parietis]|uniref:Uncharacterized protein n=1 Tax=Citricoccus parietis TaxID=592307 RepID=A0ABV5FYN9_9MICC